jgi:hypothetical protein
MGQAILYGFLILALIGWVEAKPYRAMSINNPNYKAEIPDSVILPDTSKFELAEPPRKHPNDPNLIMLLYQNPAFRYFDITTGEEIFPFMELIKKQEGAFHLVTLAFINEEGKIEVYEDEDAFKGRAIDRLIKFPISKERRISKAPR